jgi:hypothetical protein
LPAAEAQALALSSFFAVDPVLFAGFTGAGVCRSNDRGRTWSPSGLAGRSVTDLVWLGPTLYAATDAGLFLSPDSGATWQPIGEGLGGAVPRRLLLPLAPAAGAELFLATDRGVYRSSDGGRSFGPVGLTGQSVLGVATFPAPERARGKKK